MKKGFSILMVFALVLVSLCLPVQNVEAEEPYTFVTPGKSMAEAPAVELNQMYASSLTNNESIYFKFTTPEQKGYFDFYGMNVTIQTHSWSVENYVRFEIINSISESKTHLYLGYGKDGVSNLSLLPSTTYYVWVHNIWAEKGNTIPTGNLKFKINYTADLGGNNKANAEKIELAQTVTGSMDGYGDWDAYSFNSGEFENFKFTAKNVTIPTHSWSRENMFLVRISNSIDEVISELRMGYGKEESAQITLQPNTVYYVYAYNPTWSSYGIGNYTFSIDPIRTPLEDATIEYSQEAEYTGKEIKPEVKVTYQGTVLTEKVDYTVSYSKNILPGTGKITLKGKGVYYGTVTLKFKILKADQSMKLKAAKIKAGFKALKTKKLTVSRSEYLTVKKAQGKVTYSIEEAGKLKGVKINKKTGALTIPKGTKKGTYTIQVAVTAKGDKIYSPCIKLVKVKIVVK